MKVLIVEDTESVRFALRLALEYLGHEVVDRKSTRLNSSHLVISYAVFCLKKKKKTGTYGFVHRTRHRRQCGKLNQSWWRRECFERAANSPRRWQDHWLGCGPSGTISARRT